MELLLQYLAAAPVFLIVVMWVHLNAKITLISKFSKLNHERLNRLENRKG